MSVICSADGAAHSSSSGLQWLRPSKGQNQLLVKGAAECILQRCTQVRSAVHPALVLALCQSLWEQPRFSKSHRQLVVKDVARGMLQHCTQECCLTCGTPMVCRADSIRAWL